MTRVFHRRLARRQLLPPLSPDSCTFHRSLPDYRPSDLIELPWLAEALNVGRVFVKMETDRFGLPSFKVLGTSWALIASLQAELPGTWTPSDGLAGLDGGLKRRRLVTATAGNHGHALARLGATLDFPVQVFAPSSLDASRKAAIAAEGAEILEVEGDYDDAVRAATRQAANERALLISDTSWTGYEAIPRAVIDGYSTILHEVDEQLPRYGVTTPDAVFVQLGVGAFGAAVVRHFRERRAGPVLIGVEPSSAACVLASLAADRLVTVPGPHDSVMQGLNCGTPSLIAWPMLRAALDTAVAVDDERVIDYLHLFAQQGYALGECSLAGCAAAHDLLTGPDSSTHRATLGIGADSVVLLFATEGPTATATQTTGPHAARRELL
jgi:diaminopropionate ammonia-lyase